VCVCVLLSLVCVYIHVLCSYYFTTDLPCHSSRLKEQTSLNSCLLIAPDRLQAPPSPPPQQLPSLPLSFFKENSQPLFLKKLALLLLFRCFSSFFVATGAPLPPSSLPFHNRWKLSVAIFLTVAVPLHTRTQTHTRKHTYTCAYKQIQCKLQAPSVVKECEIKVYVGNFVVVVAHW